MYGNPGDGWEGYDRMQPAEPIKKTVTVGKSDSIITIVAGIVLLSLFGAFSFGLAGWVLTGIAGAPKPWEWGGGSFVVFLIVFYVFLLRRVVRLAEAFFGVDINGDGKIGDPENEQQSEPAQQTIYLEPVYVPQLGSSAKTREDFLLPDPQMTTKMAIALMQNGYDYFTADNFTTGKNGTKCMTREWWDESFFPAMERSNMAHWKDENNHRLGVYLTAAGQNYFRHKAGRFGTGQMGGMANQLPAQGMTVYPSETVSPSPTGEVSTVRNGKKRG